MFRTLGHLLMPGHVHNDGVRDSWIDFGAGGVVAMKRWMHLDGWSW